LALALSQSEEEAKEKEVFISFLLCTSLVYNVIGVAVQNASDL